MSKNMSSTNKAYEDSAKKYEQMNKKLETGETYKQSFQDAASTAGNIAAARGAQAQTGARTSGMSKAAAAEMGANARQQGYADALNNQQNMAMSARTQAVGNQGNLMQSQQTEGQNRYNRSWSNLGKPMSMVGGLLQGISDENTKNLEDNTEKSNKADWSNIDAILKKHQKNNYKDLLIKEK